MRRSITDVYLQGHRCDTGCDPIERVLDVQKLFTCHPPVNDTAMWYVQHVLWIRADAKDKPGLKPGSTSQKVCILVYIP
jgi:hypothetical protein